ncbi:hypothetical protein J416_10371 [Gracilibacillus halophilus YIM-C55.5]|uniref:DUF624 domain-containing protein n=1 Tax=Gracilibacillus halophilus YIM-C55.5 TaxID=1308866 RepID=N4WB67_9BACI|nr:YesL family protein [Gracilibacillus halophilus]ENH96494.1 hypothetical protein J416_10371 [Gracilibacillus halophilus YIM-C55.5]
MTGLWGGFYRISLWITRFAWLNVLWILGTAIGLLIFGIMPATISMFTVVRKWVRKEYDISIYHTFLSTYKKEFKISTLFMIVIAILAFLLYVNVRYTGFMYTSPIYPILFGLFIIASFFYVLLLMYIGPVFTHYHLKFWQYIKYSVLIGATNLHYSIACLTILFGIYVASFRYPGIIFVFSFSVSAYIIMFFAHLGFTQLARKQQQEAKAETQESTTTLKQQDINYNHNG